jgi:uncharacterized protein (TIGR02246 family)
MKTRVVMSSLAGLLGLALVWVLAQVAQAPASKEEEQAIRKSAEAYSEAFNKGDLEAVMEHWDADADYVDETGKTHKGKAAIASLFKKNQGNLKGHKLKFEIASVRFLRPEVAVEDGIAELTAPDGTLEKGRYTAVLVKSNGKWRISSARELPADDRAAVPTGADRLKPLGWLVGEWSSEDKGPRVTLSGRWALGQQFLVLDYTLHGKDAPEMQVTQWIGWDASTGRIKSWVFDSRGGHGEGLWTRDGNAWTAEATGVLPDGRTGAARNGLRFTDENSFVWYSTGRHVQGQPMPDTEVKFIRNAAKP